jgi:hypothetical protein
MAYFRLTTIATAVAAVVMAGCGGASGGVVTGESVAGVSARSLPAKLYVANIGDNTITTYDSAGTPIAPTIVTGTGSTDYLFAIAVAPSGKIYALNYNFLGGATSAVLTSFTPDGSPTTPTISIKEQGYESPAGIAVGANGKIYVLNSAGEGLPGIVMTYKPNGTRTVPTFKAGADSSAIFVDGNGKIYVANDTGPGGKSSVTTYLPNGTPTLPTIRHRLTDPAGIAVSSDGTIVIANATNGGPDGTGAGYITTYAANGSGPLQRIDTGAGSPGGVAVGPNGELYLASSTAYASIVKTYDAAGKRITPTITAGLDEPSGIVEHAGR